MRPVAFAAIAVLGTIACKSSTGPGGVTFQVSMQEYSFTPQVDTITAGTSVEWINNGTTTHTVTSDSAVFASGNIAAAMSGGGYGYGGGGTPAGNYRRTFSTPGTFPYHCSYHQAYGMTGTIVVVAAH